MDKSKRVVVNLATWKYYNSRERLYRELKKHWSGDTLIFNEEYEVGAPRHFECPYGFKIYTIEKAIEAGYEQILWIDSSVYPIKDITPVFDEMEKDGMIFQDAGHQLRTWTNDRTLEYFGITPDEAKEIRMIGNAGFLGFDFTNQIARRFFEWWKQAMLDGMFNESGQQSNEDFRRHTWDMSCSSAIVYKMGLTHLMKSGTEWLQYAEPGDEPFNDKVIFFAKGIG